MNKNRKIAEKLHDLGISSKVIEKALIINKAKLYKQAIENIIEKALPIGHVSDRRDGKYKKVGEGEWEKVVEIGKESKEINGVENFSEEVKKNIHDFTEKIRIQKHESCQSYDKNGEKIIEKDGNGNSIIFSPEEAEKMKKAQLFIHNHPSQGISFSREDVKFSIIQEIKEIRAVGILNGKNINYSLVNIKQPESLEEKIKLIKSYNAIESNVRKDFEDRIAYEKMTIPEANLTHHDEVVKRFSNKNKEYFKYETK